MNAGPSMLELGHPQPHTTGRLSGRLSGGDAKTPGSNSSVGCITCHLAVYPESSHAVCGGTWGLVSSLLHNPNWKDSESMKDHNSITSLSLQEALLCSYACYT